MEEEERDEEEMDMNRKLMVSDDGGDGENKLFSVRAGVCFAAPSVRKAAGMFASCAREGKKLTHESAIEMKKKNKPTARGKKHRRKRRDVKRAVLSLLWRRHSTKSPFSPLSRFAAYRVGVLK